MFIIHPPHFMPPKGTRARWLALAILFIAPIAFGCLALSLGQDANWDLRNYHFYNAYAFLNNRYAMDLLPSQTPFFYNPLIDVPFFELATRLSARTVGFIVGMVQGLNFILLFMIAHVVLIIPNPRHKVIVCAALATLGMLGGGGIAQIGTTFGDNITSLGVFLSTALVVRHIERLSVDKTLRAFGLALLFGLPSGLMMGLKLPSVIYATGLCGALLFTGKWQRGFILSFAFGLGVLLGCATTLGHWAAFLQHHFGSPLFPYFNQIFHSPLEPPVSARDIEYSPHGWRDFLFMPFLLTKYPFRVGEIDWSDWRLAILYALLPLCIILRMCFGRNRARVDAIAAPYAARYLLVSFALTYAAWLVMFTIYRYAVGIEMIAPLLIVITVGMLPLKISTRGLITGFILAVVSASIHPGNWHRRAEWTDHFIEARIPDLNDTSHLMILMAGFEPFSHLIPEFPADISFVRIQSNFFTPGQDKDIGRLIHDRIDAHKIAKGRFMMLIPTWQIPMGGEAMASFGLKYAPESCQSVTDRLFDDTQLSLCPVITD